MKQRLADYVADFLAARGVTDVFSVVGGGAMHLNDALGITPAACRPTTTMSRPAPLRRKPTPGWK